MARLFNASNQSLTGTGGGIIGAGGIVGYAAWVRVDTIGSGNFTIHEIVGANSVTNVQFLLNYNGGALYVRVYWNSLSGNDSVITGSVPIPADSQWRFVAGSLQYANGSAGHQIWYGDTVSPVWADRAPTRVTSGNTAVAGVTTPYTHRIANPGGNTVAVAHVHYLTGAGGQPDAARMERIRRTTLHGLAPTVRQGAIWPLDEGAGTAAAIDASPVWALRLGTVSNMSASQVAAAPFEDVDRDTPWWVAQATAPTVTGSSDLSATSTVTASGTRVPTGAADLSATSTVGAVGNADYHVSTTLGGSSEVRAGSEPPIETLDISNMSLDYVRTGSVNTWWPQNGELNGGQMAGNGSYSMVVDTTTPESGSAAIGWQLDNSQVFSHNPYLNRFRHYLRSPSGATGNAVDGVSDTRSKVGFAKVHGKHRVLMSALGDAWDHFYTNTPIVVLEDAARTPVAQLWVKARGEGHAFYLVPGNAAAGDIDGHPEWFVAHMGYDSSMASKWFDLEWVIDSEPSASAVPSGHDVRAGMRVVTPGGAPSRWHHQSWTAATWSGSNGDVVSWLYGQAQARDTAVTTVYNRVVLDAWWAVTGDRWWFWRDSVGAGHDGWGPQTKIAYLPVGTTTLLNESSAWTVNALNAVPASHATATTCATLDRKLVVDVTDLAITPGTILGVAAKVVADHNSGAATNSNGLELALCDTSNNFAKTQAVNVRGGSQCQQAYHLASSTNLAGQPWTVSDVNALRFGFRSSANTTSNSWRLFGAGVYVAYAPAQTATVTSVGQPAAAPTATASRQNAGQGANDPRGDYTNPANALRTNNWWEWWPALTTDLTGNNTAFPVFVDYNPVNDRYYASFWGASPFGGHGTAASSTDICAGVVEWDPFTGTKKIIWRADESAPSLESGGPHVSNSGNYTWWLPSSLTASTVHGPSNRFNLHALRVDKRPYLDDGTTPNPFYGHLFATFMSLQTPQQECKNNQMVLWLNPTRTAVQNADGSARSTVRASSGYCWARRIDMPATGTTDNTTPGSPGSYWCCPTERYIFATRIATAYTVGAVSGGQIMWLDKKPFATSSTDGLHGQRWSGATAGVGYPQPKTGETTFDAYWSIKNVGGSVTSGYINQQYYCGGYLWTSALQLRRLDPIAGDIGASLKEIEFKRGTDNVLGGDIAQANMRYVTVNPHTQKVWASAYLGASSRNGPYYDCNYVIEVDPNNGSGNPEILRWFRVPTETGHDLAGTTGAMTGQQEIHGLQCLDDDTILVNLLEEVDANGSGVWFPYGQIWLLRPSRNEWIELGRPAKNAALVPMLPFLPEDGGVYERPSPPATGEPQNRRKAWRAWKASGTALPDSFGQFLGSDLGWPILNSASQPWKYRAGGGSDEVDHQTNGYIVRWWAPARPQAADETLVTIKVDLSGITPTPPSQIDEWVCEVGGTGTLGSGAAVDGGTNVAADVDGTATLVGHVRGSDYKPGAHTAAVEFFWRIGSVWSARRAS